MKELKCPKCGNVFTVDESDYADIVNQVKNAEFHAEVDRRLKEMEKQQALKQQTDILKAEQRLHIITGNSQLSASRLLAAHFKQETANYKGKKIQGDDSFLTTAISRDPLSITVNSLSNVFDLESRHLRQGLSLLPLELDKQGRQVLSEGSLDDIIALLEQEQYTEIPVGKIGLEYNHANPILTSFAHWVLQNGTQYVHQYGLLSLPQKELTTQQHRLEQKNLAKR